MAEERNSVRAYAPDTIKQAIEYVEVQGLSYRQASARAGCAATTQFKHKHQRVKYTSVGRPTALTPQEVKVIARCITSLGSLGHPPSRDMVGSVIKKYFNDSGMQNPFPSGFPSKKWLKNFFTRWPSLSERKPEHLTIQRAKAGSTEVVDKLFSNLEKILQEKGLLTLPYSELGRSLWNCDETGLCTSVTSKKSNSTKRPKRCL